MSEKISDYTADATSNPIKNEDLMDFSNEDGAGAFDVSKKITVLELLTFLNTAIDNIYTANGTLPENRTVTAATFFTKFHGGDVIAEMNNESDDYAFLVNAVGAVEAARLGYDQITQSAIFELSNLVNKYIEFNDNKVNLNVDSFATWAVSEPQLSTANAGFIGQVKTDRVGYFNNIGFATSGFLGAFEVLIGLGITTLTADRTQTLQDKDGIIALLSDIPAGGGGLYGGSGSLQSGFTTVTMGVFDTLQFLKSGGAGTIVSVSDGTDEAFFGGKIVGVNDITNSKKLQLDSTINGISFIDGNVGGGTQNIIFQEPTSLITHNLTLPVDVSGTVALTSDIPQGLAETIAINNTILDSQQIESVDGKAILQVNNLGVAAFKGTVGVDVVSSLDISDTQAQFFLFSADFSRVGGFGLFANDVLRNFNAGAGDSYPTRISAKGGILNQDVKNSVQIGGNSTIVKTDETAYCNQLAFNTGEAFESLVTYTTPTADRTITLPDADINFETAITEVLNFATDAAGQVSTMTFANGVLVSRTLSV